MSIRISLAPFQGITSRDYRNAWARHFPGLDCVYTPFVSGVHPEKLNPVKFRDMVPMEDNVIETVPQLLSNDPVEIMAASKFLRGEGYTHINWNMGCPFSRLANKKRGCGILPYKDEIREMLDRIMPEIPLQLSIKTRLGYKSNEELPGLIHIFNQYPIHELIIHPRIGTQLYSGDVNLDGFENVLKESKIPVAYNGDIFHAGRYRQLQKRFPGINSWMIGRGALINPFLASQMKGIELSEREKRTRVKDFYNELLQVTPRRMSNPVRQLGFLKAIWYYMSGLFVDGMQYFDKIKVCRNMEEFYPAAEILLSQPFAGEHEIEEHFRFKLKHL
ncbi:MAG: tRNA-dihydrouridine synthase family protein [Bacteroidales bacterium]|nr:tRNA-dihydrouridine synthase family protein [Bacteroidales bacterium]